MVQPKNTVFEIPKDKIRKVVLHNGMTILAYKESSAPKVLAQIAYDIGSAVEQSHERGLAHLVEHMIFKGTEKLSEVDIAAIASKFGAAMNAFTSQDITSYFFQTDKANWYNFIHIMFDCMKNARFDQQHLASELKTVVQELSMRRDNHVLGIIEKAFNLAFPANHPYHFPIIGFKEELANLTAADVKKFYEKYYHPERATLFLVGDIDLEKDVNFVAEVFNALPATKSEALASFPPVIQLTETTHTTIYQEIQMSYSSMFWTIPGKAQGGVDTPTILAIILGNGQTGRLQQKLVDELKIADMVSCMPMMLNEAGLFFILFAPKAGQKDLCYKIISDELQSIIKDAPTAEELQRAVAKQNMMFFMQIEQHMALVYQWISSFFATRNEFDFFAYPEKIESLTTTDIQNYVQQKLHPFLASKIDLLPIEESKKPLWQDAITKIRAQENKILDVHQRTALVESPKFLNTLGEPKTFEFNFPEPTDIFTLPCGLKVLVRVDKKIPTISAQFAFKDAAYFKNAKEGSATELMTQLLIEGSKGSIGKQENTNRLDILGAMYGFSAATCSLNVTAANFPQALEQFFRIITEPQFEASAFAKVKEISLRNIDMVKDQPIQLAIRALWQELHKGTVLDWNFDAAKDFIKNLELSEMQALHEKTVCPQAMLLSLVGDINITELKTTLEKLTAGWGDPTKIFAKKILPNPKQTSALELKIPMLRDQAVLIFGRGNDVDFYHKDAVALKILSKILFEGMNSRMFKIRVKTGLFYTASGAFAPGDKHNNGSELVYALLNPANAQRTAELIAAMLAEVCANGVTKAELDAAKQMTLQMLVQIASNNSALASQFTMLENDEFGFDYYKKYWDTVQALTVAEINAVAKKHCSLAGMAKIQAGGA